jgi:hypothetical protein
MEFISWIARETMKGIKTFWGELKAEPKLVKYFIEYVQTWVRHVDKIQRVRFPKLMMKYKPIGTREKTSEETIEQLRLWKVNKSSTS